MTILSFFEVFKYFQTVSDKNMWKSYLESEIVNILMIEEGEKYD